MGPSPLPLDIRLCALDMAPVMIRDFNGTVRFWSPALHQLYGFHAEQALGRCSHELLRTTFPSPLADIERELRLRGQWVGELAHHHADGKLIIVASHWSLGRISGAPIVTEINNDITERKWDREEGFRLGNVIECSEDAIVGMTPSGIVTDWSAAAEMIFGYTKTEMIGQSILKIVPEELHDEEASILRRISYGERIRHYETTRHRKDGRTISVALTVSPIGNTAGQIVGVSKIARDITEERVSRERLTELSAELAHLGRLTAMGEVAATLSHELQQPITALTNYSETLAQMLETGRLDRDLARLIVDKMSHQVLRTGQVIRRVRDFVANRGTQRSTEDINGLVREAVELVRMSGGASGVRISLMLDPKAGAIHADRVQIEQVIVNLLRNAMDALDGQSRREIVVTTERNSSQDTVAVHVADTGPGIAPDVVERLFQPFVTSKKAGLGIGLSISRDIARAHSGDIKAATRPGGGAVFSVTLPTVAQAQTAPDLGRGNADSAR
jgi:two-component system sensor kinase FixL